MARLLVQEAELRLLDARRGVVRLLLALWLRTNPGHDVVALFPFFFQPVFCHPEAFS